MARRGRGETRSSERWSQQGGAVGGCGTRDGGGGAAVRRSWCGVRPKHRYASLHFAEGAMPRCVSVCRGSVRALQSPDKTSLACTVDLSTTAPSSDPQTTQPPLPQRWTMEAAPEAKRARVDQDTSTAMASSVAPDEAPSTDRGGRGRGDQGGRGGRGAARKGQGGYPSYKGSKGERWPRPGDRNASKPVTDTVERGPRPQYPKRKVCPLRRCMSSSFLLWSLWR